MGCGRFCLELLLLGTCGGLWLVLVCSKLRALLGASGEVWSNEDVRGGRADADAEGDGKSAI
jgi:hypothetical protein